MDGVLDAVPDWLLIGLGLAADLAVLYGFSRLARGWWRRRAGRSG